jgi:hypothetical protein
MILGRIRTAPALLACAGLVGATLSGCGSSGVASAVDPVAQAAEATTHADGAQLALRASVELPAAGAPLTIAGHGEINLKEREGELFMSIGGLPASIAQKLPSGGLAMTELLTKDTIYIGSPAFASKLPHGAKWLKVDLAKAAAGLGLEPQALTSGQTDPGQYLQYLKASGGHVQKLGGETVRGVATTRYRGSIDLHRAAELLPAKDRAASRAAAEKAIAQLGTASLPIEVWIDSRHMVRKLQLSLSSSVSGQHVGTKIEEELFGFGPTPGVNPPASDEVLELPDSSLASPGAGIG